MGNNIVKCSTHCRLCIYRTHHAAPFDKWNCNYCDINHHSRMYEDGKKVCEDGYYNKFVEGDQIMVKDADYGKSKRTKVI